MVMQNFETLNKGYMKVVNVSALTRRLLTNLSDFIRCLKGNIPNFRRYTVVCNSKRSY